MRIWDIHPGYLNRQSLLGEHRELHGLVSILVNGKQGYARHPETLRWVGYGWAIRQRHRQLVCEMQLRGYRDQTAVRTRSGVGVWPADYIDEPHVQFQLLKGKYRDKEGGRIPLPRNSQELWSHHKYSILARSQVKYREIGRKVADRDIDLRQLALELVALLRIRPGEGGIRNALQHMWGYVSEGKKPAGVSMEHWPLRRLLRQTQENARELNAKYLLQSTALSELMAWL